MEKIYNIMNASSTQSATEYLPGVRLSKNQAPQIDCSINIGTPTIIPGRALPLQR